MNATALKDSLLSSLESEIEVGSAGGKLYCALPLEYPGGDSVVVYLMDRGDEGIEVSDYGVGWGTALETPGVKAGRLKSAGRLIASDLGVHLVDGWVAATWRHGNLADLVWRVGLASNRLSDAPSFMTTERPPRESDFTATVDEAVSAKTPVERAFDLEGSSGHVYTTTLYIPTRHAVIEPWTPVSGWNRAIHVYAEFGDLASANGFKRYAVIDDREAEPMPQVLSLLTQVSDVVQWSRRDSWLYRLGE